MSTTMAYPFPHYNSEPRTAVHTPDSEFGPIMAQSRKPQNTYMTVFALIFGFMLAFFVLNRSPVWSPGPGDHVPLSGDIEEYAIPYPKDPRSLLIITAISATSKGIKNAVSHRKICTPRPYFHSRTTQNGFFIAATELRSSRQ